MPKTVEVIAFGHKNDNGTELWLFTALHIDGATHQAPSLEAKLQGTLNLIPAHTWYALPSGGLTFASGSTAGYLGLPKTMPPLWYRHGLVVGFAHPTSSPRRPRRGTQSLVHVFTHDSAGQVSFRVRDAEGGYRWFISRAEPFRANDGIMLLRL